MSLLCQMLLSGNLKLAKVRLEKLHPSTISVGRARSC